jgi:hypothetical protein
MYIASCMHTHAWPVFVGPKFAEFEVGSVYFYIFPFMILLPLPPSPPLRPSC